MEKQHSRQDRNLRFPEKTSLLFLLISKLNEDFDQIWLQLPLSETQKYKC